MPGSITEETTMGYRKRLDRAFEDVPCLPLHRGTRYILMSDCHRGTGMSYDNFLKNQHTIQQVRGILKKTTGLRQFDRRKLYGSEDVLFSV